MEDSNLIKNINNVRSNGILYNHILFYLLGFTCTD